MQGRLPKGSVRLGTSQTGATLYVEPQPLLALNNGEALAAEAEADEETRVLLLLSRLLAERAPPLLAMLAAATRLDVIAARAAHGRWLRGTRPTFVGDGDDGGGGSEGGGPEGGWAVHLPGARHPVLMQPALAPLPQPPSSEDNSFGRNFTERPPWEAQLLAVAPQAPAPPPSASGGGAAALPRPLDLRIPAAARVVAITGARAREPARAACARAAFPAAGSALPAAHTHTPATSFPPSLAGPNTGGKTATIKALGLMALMAKAGLFLPLASPEELSAAASGGGAGAAVGGSGPRPRLRWFDRVLADVGDSQSLQQNLSTFSGHIGRIKQASGGEGGPPPAAAGRRRRALLLLGNNAVERPAPTLCLDATSSMHLRCKDQPAPHASL
jgi:DNA mismatch repair protein MutS2